MPFRRATAIHVASRFDLRERALRRPSTPNVARAGQPADFRRRLGPKVHRLDFIVLLATSFRTVRS